MMSKKYVEIGLANFGVNEDGGILQDWLVEEGQFVNIGTKICTFETTKTVVEIDAESEGFIIPTVSNKAEVRTNETIAILVESEKNIDIAKKTFYEHCLLYTSDAADE